MFLASPRTILRMKSIWIMWTLIVAIVGGYTTYTAFLSFAPMISLQSPVFVVLTSQWLPYSNRYAVIVMGGDETGQMYTWYWQDSYGMYQHLIALGFTAANIHFLSYGSEAEAHPEAVDGVSTKANVQWAFDQVRMKSTLGDLVYVLWVDHGTNQLFNLHEGTTITHVEYANCIKNISARVIVGAYNPCYSGAVIDNISRLGVISATSVNAHQANAAGWAGWWRTALAGGTSGDPSDRNGDGHIDMAEAYEWVASKSQGYRPAAEHPLFDDNGDDVGSEYNTAGYNSNDPNKDGFRGRMYSLTGWRSIPVGDVTTSTTETTSSFSTSASTSFSLQPETLTATVLLSVVVIVILFVVVRLRARVPSHVISSPIKYCTNCGNKLLGDATFCHFCGSKQIEDQL